MKKLYNFNNRTIKYIFYLLFTLTFLFALTSSNLILGDNNVTKIGTTAFTTIVLLIFAFIGLVFYLSSKFRNFCKWLFIDNRWITSSVCLLLAVIIQIVFLYLVHSPIGFDVSGVHQGMTRPNDVEIVGYFSVNPNNLGIFLFQNLFKNIFHSTSWELFEFITMFLVDLSAAFNIFSIAIIDKTKVPIGMYIHAIWLATFPAILVPYTDTWAIQFVAIYIFCYCGIAYTNWNKFIKFILVVPLGISLSAGYFVKPSTIIPMIAIIIIELIHLLKKEHHQWLWLFLLCITFVGSVGSSYYQFNKVIKTQNYVRVYTFRAKPMIHFINMGLSGDGGYNAKDSFKVVTLIHKKDRINYSVNSIHKRLHKMGFGGYLAFLLKKQGNNTSDGTFAWLRDGDFVPMKHSPEKKGIRGKIQNFFYLYGNNVGDFRFLTQIWWCIWLGLIFFAWKDDRKITQTMRLALVGGFIFLLIFEGGRSRYLIQFLPAFLILATCNFETSIKQIKSLLVWK